MPPAAAAAAQELIDNPPELDAEGREIKSPSPGPVSPKVTNCYTCCLLLAACCLLAASFRLRVSYLVRVACCSAWCFLLASANTDLLLFALRSIGSR